MKFHRAWLKTDGGQSRHVFGERYPDGTEFFSETRDFSTETDRAKRQDEYAESLRRIGVPVTAENRLVFLVRTEKIEYSAAEVITD
ncbi:hypothetical protein M2390_002586 [Mycetocola sp. BIGb0189]|uniref:hypothetical protein n=1 Tax=Mycetocola sp. BIGb0189 TaxID=2940604 RepID=UPI002169D093|nr:hypothetical protein [Mycetocola sp. BIGb0189]MCS4277380.1 hypothetical protein [Mycetocola sp. BIGb0189]